MTETIKVEIDEIENFQFFNDFDKFRNSVIRKFRVMETQLNILQMASFQKDNQIYERETRNAILQKRLIIKEEEIHEKDSRYSILEHELFQKQEDIRDLEIQLNTLKSEIIEKTEKIKELEQKELNVVEEPPSKKPNVEVESETNFIEFVDENQNNLEYERTFIRPLEPERRLRPKSWFVEFTSTCAMRYARFEELEKILVDNKMYFFGVFNRHKHITFPQDKIIFLKKLSGTQIKEIFKKVIKRMEELVGNGLIRSHAFLEKYNARYANEQIDDWNVVIDQGDSFKDRLENESSVVGLLATMFGKSGTKGPVFLVEDREDVSFTYGSGFYRDRVTILNKLSNGELRLSFNYTLKHSSSVKAYLKENYFDNREFTL